MQNKLQQLTEKLYNEGLSKGQKEANELLSKAQEEAKQIVEKAKKEAEAIISQANKQISESKTNADTEMKMAARQVMASVKQATGDAIITKAVTSANKAAFNDTDFIKSIIKTAIEKFNPNNLSNLQLSIILPEDKKAEMSSFIEDKAIKEMTGGLDIRFDKRFKAGFKIAPKDEGYYISFTEQDFENLFREFLRPKMVSLLFGEKDNN